MRLSDCPSWTGAELIEDPLRRFRLRRRDSFLGVFLKIWQVMKPTTLAVKNRTQIHPDSQTNLSSGSEGGVLEHTDQGRTTKARTSHMAKLSEASEIDRNAMEEMSKPIVRKTQKRTTRKVIGFLAKHRITILSNVSDRCYLRKGSGL
jgi:hypothetical protein